LFNLSWDYVIDACRKGNKSRFINHSDSPNCETRTLFVNGDQRIGFYASVDIKAECELFFNCKCISSFVQLRLPSIFSIVLFRHHHRPLQRNHAKRVHRQVCKNFRLDETRRREETSWEI
jgi:hypothetical protein